MIQKKRELHLSYSQAFGVARKPISSAHAIAQAFTFLLLGYVFKSPNFESIPNIVNALYINMLYV